MNVHRSLCFLETPHPRTLSPPSTLRFSHPISSNRSKEVRSTPCVLPLTPSSSFRKRCCVLYLSCHMATRNTPSPFEPKQKGNRTRYNQASSLPHFLSPKRNEGSLTTSSKDQSKSGISEPLPVVYKCPSQFVFFGDASSTYTIPAIHPSINSPDFFKQKQGGTVRLMCSSPHSKLNLVKKVLFAPFVLSYGHQDHPLAVGTKAKE